MKAFWLYCNRCGWQTAEPDSACAPTCPDCWARLSLVKMSPSDFKQHEVEIKKTSLKKFFNARPELNAVAG